MPSLVRFSRVVVAGALLPGWCAAVVIRHDVPDAAYLNYAAEPQFAGVGQVIAGGLIGGGTLIRPDWVLTAAHVADNGPVETTTFKLNGVSYPAAEEFIWPAWDGNVQSGDIALIRLATPIPGVSSTDLFTGSDEIGRVGSLTGMGLTGTGETGWGPYDALKRAGENVITIADSRFLYANFDAPASGLALPLEAGHALGDSGSGMFVRVGEAWQIAGINSWISDVNHNGLLMDYGDRMAVTRVSRFASWANQIIPEPGVGTALLALAPFLLRTRRVVNSRLRHWPATLTSQSTKPHHCPTIRAVKHELLALRAVGRAAAASPARRPPWPAPSRSKASR